MVNYTRLASIAQKLITKNGVDVTLKKLGRTPNDPTKPWRGTNPAGEVSVVQKGVLLNYEENQIDGDLIRRGDRKALIAFNDSQGEDIREFDILEEGSGEVWKLEDVELLEPGPTGLIYTLQLRR